MKERGQERPKTVRGTPIEDYIPLYESRQMTLEKIAQESGLTLEEVKRKIGLYYKKTGRIAPNYRGVIKKIAQLLKSYTREQIREMARKRNMIISDEDFEQAQKLIDNKKQKQDDEIPI